MKVLNRSLKIGGENRTINAVDIRVIMYDPDGNVLFARGTSVPTGAGYAKGALFIKTDAATGVKGLYENEGTTASASFNLVGSVTAGEIGLVEGSMLIGNSSGVASAIVAKTSGRILVGNGTTAVLVAVSGDATLASNGALTIAAGAVEGSMLGLGTSGSPLAHTAVSDKAYQVHTTQSSTDAGTSYEPVLFSTVLTGAGQVGGRVRALMTTNVALGSWANALKGEVVFQSAGRVTGLASAVLAEMTLPGAALTTGNYAALEMELNLPASFTTGVGTPTAFQYMSVQGDAVTEMDDEGFLFILNGLTAGVGKLFQTNTAADATHALRVLIGGTPYYIMLTSVSSS